MLVFAVGVMQLVPGLGVFRRDFHSIYGVDVSGSDLLVLMRNRAVYIGGVGALLVVSAFRPQLRLAAIALSAVTLGSYVVLAAMAGPEGARLRQLMVIDIVLVVLLMAAAVAHVAADA